MDLAVASSRHCRNVDRTDAVRCTPAHLPEYSTPVHLPEYCTPVHLPESMLEPHRDTIRCDALLFCADVCSILMTSLLPRYDLVDLGRDVLARLTTPISQNFTTSLGNASTRVDAAECARSGKLYVELLMDLDTLVVGEIAHRSNCPTTRLYL